MAKRLFTSQQRALAETVRELSYCNPFLPRCIDLERLALGDAFREGTANWNIHPDREPARSNLQAVTECVEAMAEQLRQRLIESDSVGDDDLALYENIVLFLLYHRYNLRFQEQIDRASGPRVEQRGVRFYRSFVQDAEHFLAIPNHTFKSLAELAHIFACFFQIRRAFHQIFQYIIGVSAPAVRLRAAVWESIFSHDMRRYRRVLYDQMADYTTLITGPSGTGKELVARAIALSQYIPFDGKSQTFGEDFTSLFHALNLSALSPTLIESELFGYRKGAFTGALADRAGWLEICPCHGTVFLDEIGELDTAIQVKLLRVLQTRVFQRIGATQSKRFQGKIIAATNRDLALGLQEGAFREDFYYRICSDLIVTPSLREQLRDDSDELNNLVSHIARRAIGDEEAQELTQEVLAWIDERLGQDYGWPGNVRELEQCVRNVLIHKAYWPRQTDGGGPVVQLDDVLTASGITVDDLLTRYCTIVYHQVGSYEEAGRRLQLDRRTVKAKVDPQLLAQLRIR